MPEDSFTLDINNLIDNSVEYRRDAVESSEQ